MKKVVYFLLFSIIVGEAMFSCEKEIVVPQSTIVAKNAVRVTPSEKVIPYSSERGNSEEYVRNNISESKVDNQKLGNKECQSQTIYLVRYGVIPQMVCFSFF